MKHGKKYTDSAKLIESLKRLEYSAEVKKLKRDRKG